MLPSLFLHAASAVSPQASFGETFFAAPPLPPVDRRFYVQDADYRQYINPVAIRRMSRLLKMTISSAMRCLQLAGWDRPDAIITGTGRGSLTDMEGFLKDMIRLEEGALNPTLFIQSTYNAPNGWIALQSKSTGYNQTFVHRGHSFELGLLDAALHLAETSPETKILAGCYDELSEEYFLIKDRLDYWQKADSGAGAIAGEGSAFFAFSGVQADDDRLAIRHLELIPDNATGFAAALDKTLKKTGISAADIALLLSGHNGHRADDALYGPLQAILPQAAVTEFKRFCGEYDTSTGFGLWLAQAMCSQPPMLPGWLFRDDQAGWQGGGYVLLANHYLHRTGVLLLMECL